MDRYSLLGLCAALFLWAGSAAAQVYVSPDVGTDPDGPTGYLPWQVVRSVTTGPSFYSLELEIAGHPAIDAAHKLDRAGGWLFSVETPSDLGGLLEVHPEDVVRRDAGGALSLFFDGSCVSPAVPAGSNVNALFMIEDSGALFVVFDSPTTLGAVTFLPTQIVQWTRLGPGACDWAAPSLVLDVAAVSGSFFPAETRVTGLDRAGDVLFVAFDIPVDPSPTAGPSTYLPGQIASLNLMSGTWDLSIDLLSLGTPGWPVSSQVDALSCEANPGRIDPDVQPMLLDRSGTDLTIVCPSGCSSGALRYGVYEGTLASLRSGVYDHEAIDCDAVCAGSNTFSPGAGDRYYLVVPHNLREEGSYGFARSGGGTTERPQAALGSRCQAPQVLTDCP